MKSQSHRRPGCCFTSAHGLPRRWQPFSIARPADRLDGPACSPRPRLRCAAAGFGCCHCRVSARCAACVAAGTPGRRASMRAGSASRSRAPSKFCEADGGCSCVAAPRPAATGSGSTPGARRARRTAHSAGRCARARAGRCAIPPGVPPPQGGHPALQAPIRRDVLHVLTNRRNAERELSRHGPVYSAHDAHAPWSIAWQQDSRTGSRA